MFKSYYTDQTRRPASTHQQFWLAMVANDMKDFRLFRKGPPCNKTFHYKRNFFVFRLAFYRQKFEQRGSTLSEYSANDFCDIDVDGFKEINSDDRGKLWDLLQICGFYVFKGRSILISDALFAVMKEDIPCLSGEARDDVDDNDRSADDLIETAEGIVKGRNGHHDNTKKESKDDQVGQERIEPRLESSSRSERPGTLSNLIKA